MEQDFDCYEGVKHEKTKIKESVCMHLNPNGTNSIEVVHLIYIIQSFFVSHFDSIYLEHEIRNEFV